MDGLEFVHSHAGGFLLVFVGTMLLFAEVLVRGRFVLGAIGLVSIGLYFTSHVDSESLLWIAGLYVAGILLVVLDGKFIGDGTLGGIGALLMIVALAIPSPDVVFGILVVGGFVFGGLSSLLFLRYMPRRKVWSKLALYDSLSSEKGYNSMNEEYVQFIGKEGIALTAFRPGGTIELEGKTYSAVSDGQWIDRGSRLRVIEVSGTRILVEKIADAQDRDDRLY